LIHTDNNISQRILSKISSVDGVSNVEIIEKVVRVKVDSVANTITKILNLIEAEKINVKSISIEKPTLEQVFVEYTGRMFRDEEPADSRRMIAIWRRRR
jgi:ABC-2 type transport system ATP-binding protein